MTTEIAIIINARLAIWHHTEYTSLKRKNLKWRDDALWTHHAFTCCVRLNAYRFPVTDKNRITDSLWKVRKISSCDNDKNHTRTTYVSFLWWLLHYSAVQFLLLYYLADIMADVTWHSINNCSMLFLEANYTSNSFADTVDSRHRTIAAY